MKIRVVVLTVLLIGLVIPAFSQLEDLFIGRTRPMAFVNDPFMPVVKVLLIIEHGKILLKLQNGFHQTVQLNGVFIVSKGMKAALLEEAEELVPADSRYFDVSSHLRRCFDPSSTVRQEEFITVYLRVDPEPKRQLKKVTCRVSFEDGIFTVSDESQAESS